MSTTSKVSAPSGHGAKQVATKRAVPGKAAVQVSRKSSSNPSVQSPAKKTVETVQKQVKHPVKAAAFAATKLKPLSASTKTQSALSVRVPQVSKDKKVEVIRDSFSIPKIELNQIDSMKKRAVGMGVSVKKSELIRAGLLSLMAMQDAAFKNALVAVPTIKTGRPVKI
jgi:hypothetical protein